MQLVGIALLVFVVWFGFADRSEAGISAFDIHALIVVFLGSTAAVLVSSTAASALRTLVALRECVPGLRRFKQDTQRYDQAREKLAALWIEGKRSAAVELSEASGSSLVKTMMELLLTRASPARIQKVFVEHRHAEIEHWQPAILNWEMLSKLGPAFGMVGTITGMVSVFRNMSSENMNIGASMSMALLATLYGVAFGTGLAGPLGHYLNGLLDDRLGLLERCEKTVFELLSLKER